MESNAASALIFLAVFIIAVIAGTVYAMVGRKVKTTPPRS